MSKCNVIKKKKKYIYIYIYIYIIYIYIYIYMRSLVPKRDKRHFFKKLVIAKISIVSSRY